MPFANDPISGSKPHAKSYFLPLMGNIETSKLQRIDAKRKGVQNTKDVHALLFGALHSVDTSTRVGSRSHQSNRRA